jgi:hypothetical protein
MLKEKNSLSVLLIMILVSLLNSGCRTFPKLEYCIIGDQGLICHDSRLPDGIQDYERKFDESKNYVCTNADDFTAAREWVERNDK